MERIIHVLKQLIELLETCLEALEHIKLRLSEGYTVVTINLMEDLIFSYYHIESTLISFLNKLPDNQIDSALNNLRLVIGQVMTAYEQKDWGKVREVIQFSMSPRFQQLKTELGGLIVS